MNYAQAERFYGWLRQSHGPLEKDFAMELQCEFYSWAMRGCILLNRWSWLVVQWIRLRGQAYFGTDRRLQFCHRNRRLCIQRFLAVERVCSAIDDVINNVDSKLNDLLEF